MLTAHNFTYGVVTPVLGYLMSCLGAFLGLRCTARARACTGQQRFRWLLLAAISIGSTGIWVMHFIAMLGYTIPGQTIHYNVLLTIASMLIAVVVVGVGLLIVGFGQRTWRNLIAAGAFTGVGVAAMHYTGMAAMRVPVDMTFGPELFGLSIVIAVVAATAALWAATNLSGLRATIGAALIMGVAVSGMHYTGMAAMHVFSPGAGGGMNMTGGGATAEGFLLPLVIGISILAFILTATLALSPTDEEMRADAELMQRIQGGPDGRPVPVVGNAVVGNAVVGNAVVGNAAAGNAAAGNPVAGTPAAGAQRYGTLNQPGPVISRAAQARRQADRNGDPFYSG